MLEAIIKPKNAEKTPWIMLIVGFIYALLSLVLVKIFFGGDTVLSRYSGVLVVTFCVMFSLPFMYFIIKKEELEDEEEPDEGDTGHREGKTEGASHLQDPCEKEEDADNLPCSELHDISAKGESQ